MKKILLAIAFILITATCFAAGPEIWMTPAAVTASGNNSVDMSRGFEVNSNPSGWAAKDDDSSLMNLYDSASSHSGTYSMSILGNNTDTAYQVYDMGATRTPVSLSQWVYIPTNSGASDYFNLGWIGAASPGTLGMKWLIVENTGVYNLKGNGAAGYVTGTVNLTVNAWFRIEVAYTQNASSTIKIYNATGTLLDTVTVTAYNTNSRYFGNGKGQTNVTTTWGTFYFDDVGLNYSSPVYPLWPYTVGN